jgi:hypothetical protein
VSEVCDHYSLVGDVTYSLTTGQSKTFTVRFAPSSAGVKTCTNETGNGACIDVSCTGTGETPGVISVELDIKPLSCPNPLNVNSKGVLPVAILGTADFNVRRADPATVLLEGVAPLRWSYEDVARPVYPPHGICECTTLGPDKHLDLTLKFNTQAIIAALGPVHDGEVRVLTLTGMNYDGTRITGQDCVVITKPGPSKPSDGMANEFSLGDNYPNPFNPQTEIGFTVPVACKVEIKVYNVAGQLVKTCERYYPAGTHSITWDGTNLKGENVASGIYFYRMEAGDFVQQKKMVLMR